MDKANKFGRFGPMMMVALCWGIFVPNFAQYQLSPFAASIMAELDISASQFSSLFTAPMIPAILLSLVAGILVDKFNPKLIVAIAIAATAAGAVGSLLARSYLPLFLAFVLIGMSAAVINCTQAKLISGWYAPQQITGKMGVVMASSTIAMAVALATGALFPNRTVAFTVSAVLSIVGLLLWLLLYKTPTVATSAQGMTSFGGGVIAGLKVVARCRYVWVIAFGLFFIMAANVVMGSFAPTALQARGVGANAAGIYSAIYTIGCFLSCFISPFLSGKLKSTKRTVVILCALSLVLVAMTVMYVPEGFLLGAAMLLTGICVGGSIPLLSALPVQLEDVGPRYAGTAGGSIATVQLVGAVLVPSYVLIPLSGDSYGTLFLLGGICMAICGAIATFLPKGK